MTNKKDIKIMKKYELKEILNKHKEWRMSGGKLGERANLRDVDLAKVDLAATDLREVDLAKSDLSGADLRYANLECVDLSGVNLRGADLECANLSETNLEYANLRGADLRGADLSGANLTGIEVNSQTLGYYSACPEKGSFVGFKKCRHDTIVKLLIPEDAKRSSATTRKCRTNKAIVLEITNKYENQIKTTESIYNSAFRYTVGETVEVEDFNENRWEECTTGIHFFTTRKEAEKYLYK